MVKSVVTGGSGFFGLHLVEGLLKRGDFITVLDVVDFPNSKIKQRIEFIKGDIRDPHTVRKACEGTDVVYHNAAKVPVSRAGKEFWHVNVDGTKNVLEASYISRVRKVIYISSSSVYGIPKQLPIIEETALSPFGDYGRSKYEAEAICNLYRKRGLDISIIRPRTILGKGRMGILSILFDWIKKGKNFYILGSGDNRFQLVSASDMVSACILAGTKQCHNKDFCIGAEEFMTLRKDLEALAKHAGTNTRIISINQKFAQFILWTLDILHLIPFVDYHYHILPHSIWFDTSKAKALLGWSSKDSNKDMLCETYDWYLQNYKEVDTAISTTHRKSVKQGILKLLRLFS